MSLRSWLQERWLEIISAAEDPDPWDEEFESDREYWLRRKSPWIDKWDRMPERYQRVLVVTDRDQLSDMVYAGEAPCRWKLGWSEVLYWQPRPDTSGLRGVDRERRRPA